MPFSTPFFRADLKNPYPLSKKKFFKWIRIFLFLTYLFGIETIKTFIHSRSSLKNQPDSRPKWPKFLPVFRPKRRKNHTRWGSTYLYSLYKGVPAPRPPPPSGWAARARALSTPFPKTLQWRLSFPLIRGTQRQFSENICSEDDLRSRIFGTFFVKFLAWLTFLGFPNTLKKGIIAHF